MAKSKKTPESSNKKNISKLYLLKRYILPAILFALLIILSIATYQSIMSDKYYPLTFVGDTNISFLSQGRAIQTVESVFEKRSKQKLQFFYPQSAITIDLATASASLDYQELDAAFKASHFTLLNLFSNIKLTPKIDLNIDKQLDILSSVIDQQPQNASLTFDETPSKESTSSSRIQILEGSNGFSIDKEELKKEIKNYLLFGKYQNSLPLKTVVPKVTTEYVKKAKEVLEWLDNEPFKLSFEDLTWTIDAKQVLALLDLQTGESLLLDKDKTYAYLDQIASQINKEVSEGLFEFNPQTKKVTAFRPSQEGKNLNKDKTYLQLTETLINKSSKNMSLTVDIVKPKIATSDVNSLGIKELLGRGISNFTGSIPNRIYNIGLATSRINGVLVPPGQTFSFNQTVGDISAATGFKQAYVIKSGRTVLDDGGGVCQVSTTLFRAVLNAGLPVIKRTAHAYRVSYYEQGFPPGLDATVFYPSVDFQFKNDTSTHILIQAYLVGNSVYFDLYGTSDGRTTNLTQPVVTNVIPAPPELRQDDPTLPKGTVKQVDWAAKGATVTFQRTIAKNGEILINETWKSNYKPWQAIFLVGTQ